MPIVVWQTLKEPKHTPVVKAKIQTFLSKLQQDDTSPGLHIEPIHHSQDPRVRTGRVDDFWRALLFRFDPPGSDPVYVYAGTWEHDKAIAKAKVTVARQNPVNSLVAFTEVLVDDDIAYTTHADATRRDPARHYTAQAQTAAHEQGAPRHADPEPEALLPSLHYTASDLARDFGFDDAVTRRAFACVSEDELLEFALSLPDRWQQDVLVAMGAGTALHEIREQLDLAPVPGGPEDGATNAAGDAAAAGAAAGQDPAENEDARIVAALQLPAARMQFHFIEDDEDLRRVIEGGDFGAWRVFLHPEQRRYVARNYNGAFRLSGGAGTGKTVVLLHRARWLHQQNPSARIVLSTFSRALAENLARDLERLDPSVTIASALGQPGVLIRGVDQLAAEVRRMAGPAFGPAMRNQLGADRDLGVSPREPDWAAAIDDVSDGLAASPGVTGPPLAGELGQPGFYDGEYSQVVLPAGITTRESYFSVRRPGRGVALNRAKRALAWRVIEQMRAGERLSGHVSFAEIAACAAHWLGASETTVADHVLVDEGQDLEPAKWLFMRALVAEGPNDLFIADDSHQRIYGRSTVFSRYGISIRGRSRRLTLNYRTTLENLRYALGLLEGAAYEDSEEHELSVAGYRSVRTGPTPRVHAANDDDELISLVAADLAAWRTQEVPGGAIAILVASNYQAELLQRGLEALGQQVTVTRGGAAGMSAGTGGAGSAGSAGSAGEIGAGHPVVLTMQRAKGLEFSRVILFDVSARAFPPRSAVRGLTGSELADRLQQFRSQLYVAASRARDELVVTWTGVPSALLGK